MKRHAPDAAAVGLIVVLWGVFFWGLLTQHAPDQISLRTGDFSGQFYAFAGYQYERLASGEIPLWNPYNNGGLPFIADTQAAVFYPPRLLTITLARLSGGFSYHALELEMAFHVLALMMFMYAFVRRITPSDRFSPYAGLLSAIVIGFCGFTGGYPPLQLALLEAGIWLPLGALGIHEATRGGRVSVPWLMLAALALGLSWLAGHPQTSYFLSLAMAACWLYRAAACRLRLSAALAGLAVFAALGAGLAAVQLVPGLEYLPQTARADMTYAEKANGFPPGDVVQFVLPGVVSLFSPLYVGALAFGLGIFAVLCRAPQSLFWGILAVFALLWSFGGSGPLYPLLYNILPSASYFRGQERAAYLVAHALAVLAGLGLPPLLHALASHTQHRRRMLWTMTGVIVVLLGILNLALAGRALASITSVVLVLLALAVILGVLIAAMYRRVPWQAAALLVLALTTAELFAVSRHSPAVTENRPPDAQVSASPPDIVQAALDDAGADAPPYRVDGFRGLNDNYGSLYGVQDIHGISPLFLTDARVLIEAPFPPLAAWEVFAVRYVFSDWGELPPPSTRIADGVDRWGGISAFRLDDPRPFAQIMTGVLTAADPLSETLSGAHNLRTTLLLGPDSGASNQPPAPPQPAEIMRFAPEQIVIRAQTDTPAWLSVALVHYPGWVADIDGQPVPIVRAYGAASAIPLPTGEHIVTLSYQPASFTLGAIISIASACLILGGLIFGDRRRQEAA